MGLGRCNSHRHSQKVVMCQGELERDVLIGHGWEGDS